MNREWIQSHTYMYPFSPRRPSHPGCCITWRRAPCAVYHRPLLVSHNVHLKLPNYPSPSIFPHCTQPQVCSVSLFLFCKSVHLYLGFPCDSAGKESACNVGDLGSIPGLGRSPREGKGYPLQYSGLENSTDCIVHGVAKRRT